MKKKIWMLLASSALVLAAGCATEKKMSGTAIVPAAEGKLTADKSSGGNTDLKVEVSHLAPPQKVSSGANSYVVWVQPQGLRNFQNIGVLSVNDDLEGKYKTTIPYKNFRVLVTPEAAGNVARPTGPAVFDQTISR